MVKKMNYKIVAILVFILCIVGLLNIQTPSGNKTYQVILDTIQSPSRDFKTINMTEALDKIESNQDIVVFFGYDSCPYCKEAHPIFKEAVKQSGKEDSVYFVKTRNASHDLQYTEAQRKVLVRYMSKYMSKNDEGKEWLFVPAIVHFKDGKAVKGHVGTVKGHNPVKDKLTDKQYKKLFNEYMKILSD